MNNTCTSSFANFRYFSFHFVNFVVVAVVVILSLFLGNFYCWCCDYFCCFLLIRWEYFSKRAWCQRHIHTLYTNLHKHWAASFNRKRKIFKLTNNNNNNKNDALTHEILFWVVIMVSDKGYMVYHHHLERHRHQGTRYIIFFKIIFYPVIDVNSILFIYLSYIIQLFHCVFSVWMLLLLLP